MDTVSLVKNRIDAGQRLLDQLADKEFAVRAACWLKRVGEARWRLYVATPKVDEKGTLEAYRELIPILPSLGDSWLTSSDVTLVGEKHALVQDVVDILRRFPHKTPIHPPRSLLGGISVEGEIYAYPLGKTQVKIYHLVFPGTPEPGILSLDPLLLDGHFAVEVERQGERKVYQGETDLDCIVAAPERAQLERDENGTMILVWDLYGKPMRSTANEVWSLANLGLHGFRFLPEPDPTKA
jgi:hypothetical protein